MDRKNSEIIAEILADTQIGAGNFVYRIYQKINETSSPLIYLDQAFVDYTQRLRSDLSMDCIIFTANAYANFYKNMGIVSKEPVILYLSESINYFLQYVALTAFGAIPFFINGAMEEETVILLAMNAGAKFLITSNDRIETIRASFAAKNYHINLIDFYQILPYNNTILPEYHYDNDDTVLLTHTSGTTGIPKIVQFTHGAMIYGVRKQIEKQPGKRILSLLPHSHSSSITILMSTLLRQATIKIQAEKSSVSVLEQIKNYQPDLVVAFPKTLVDLCRYDLEKHDLSSIHYWLSTGDANHEPHIRKLISQGTYISKGIRRKGSIFIDNLGSSEFSFAMFRNIHTPDSDNYNRRIGIPFPWVETAILGGDGTLLPPQQIGYLGVKAQSVTKGYWNNTYLTEKNRLRGFWLTGDLAFQDENGIFYHVDRVSDKIITTQGVFYSCQAEEWILKNIPEIFEISFVEVKDISNQAEIVALIELEKNSENLELSFFKKKINEYLTRKKYPNITQVQLQSAHEDIGLTGKKLKRKIRQDLALMSLRN